MCQISLAACATTPWQFKIPDWIRKTIPNDSHDCSAWSQLVLELLQIRSKKNPRRLLYRPRPKSITAKMHMLWFRCNKSIDQHTYFQPCTSKQSFNMLLAGPCMTRRFVSRSFYPSKPPEPPSSSKINIGWWNLERTQPELMFTHESKTLFHSASCGDCKIVRTNRLIHFALHSPPLPTVVLLHIHKSRSEELGNETNLHCKIHTDACGHCL